MRQQKLVLMARLSDIIKQMIKSFIITILVFHRTSIQDRTHCQNSVFLKCLISHPETIKMQSELMRQQTNGDPL